MQHKLNIHLIKVCVKGLPFSFDWGHINFSNKIKIMLIHEMWLWYGFYDFFFSVNVLDIFFLNSKKISPCHSNVIDVNMGRCIKNSEPTNVNESLSYDVEYTKRSYPIYNKYKTYNFLISFYYFVDVRI